MISFVIGDIVLGVIMGIGAWNLFMFFSKKKSETGEKNTKVIKGENKK